MTRAPQRALVVIPTYDEALTLRAVVTEALAVDRRVRVLVVDDASPDGTGRIADELAAADPRVAVLHRPAKAGLGSAYRAGFAWALARDFDAVLEMDADRSHDPSDLPRLLDALTRADLVIGSRYVPGGAVVDWPLQRLALSRAGNHYVRLATGFGVRDATAGFRAFRRQVLLALDLDDVRSEGYSFQVEMALRTWRAGFRVVEVPITFTERREGASKISRAIVVEALLRVGIWGLAGPRRAPVPHPDSAVHSGPSRAGRSGAQRGPV